MSNQTERILARNLKLARRMLEPPREVSFDAASNLLSWKAPADDRLVTHYRIRIGTDGGDPAFEVSSGQRSVPIVTSATVYVSSYNAMTEIESARVSADATDASAGLFRLEVLV